MNKEQNPTTSNVRKGIKFNHNESVLKLRNHGPIGSNHNEMALKVRKGVKFNHNETALRSK